MRPLVKPVLILSVYFLWNAIFTLLILSIITYFLSRSGMTFAELSDTIATNRVVIVGIGALFFAVFVTQLNPVFHIARTELITAPKIEQEYFPGFIKGGILGCLFILLFLVARYYRYVGFFVQSENAWVASLGLILRALAILCMVYVDEYVFRHKLPEFLRKGGSHPLRTIGLCAFVYALGKSFQFSLGLSHLLTLTLVGLALNLRAHLGSSFTVGAGILGGFLAVIHCVFSIPILGNDAQGFLLLRYQFRFDVHSEWVRIFTGGVGGLLSSAALQLLLLGDIAVHLFKAKKTLLPSSLTNVR